MPDGNVPVPDVESDIDFTIQAACECYCSVHLVQAALAQQPDFKAAIAWAPPCAPDPESLIEDADLVLVVADKASLFAAKARLAGYEALQQATLLIYLADDARMSADDVQGLVISRSELPARISQLVEALIMPVIPQGLVCVDWADTRHILALDGYAFVEEALGYRHPEELVGLALKRVPERAAGRPVLGMQMSLSCSASALKMRLIHTLASACKEAIGDDGTLIVAVPLIDRPDFGRVEIRIFAKIGSAGQ